ncbi:metallophosphoesterase family protein [Rhodobacteraceae bacterium KMM 6894]|nr:metallophosphoesterase family protein [Rhodobacteraceae bacterium KMM 6894]
MIYAIGDIHGQKAQLDRALALIEADGGRDAPVVMLGDLVDRGPDSRGVIDALIAGQAAGRDWTVLQGNHDQLFLDYLELGRVHSPLVKSGRSWLSHPIGGLETLASYGLSEPDVDATRAAVPKAHADFLRALPRLHQVDDLLFVHAGIDPKLPLEWQDPDELIWIREPFLTYTDPLPWLVVHGHTAIDHPSHHGNRVNLDGGAGYGRPLIPAVIEGGKVWLLTDAGRVPLRP